MFTRSTFLKSRWGRAALVLAVLWSGAEAGWAQGCVAVRNSPTCELHPGEFTNVLSAHDVLVTVGYRWFRSDRHFVGDVEQPQRQALGTEVINDVQAFDVAATYSLTPRWTVSLDVPFTYSVRSSLYEHGGAARHTMRAGGVGDVRLLTDFWVLDPVRHAQGNLAVGIGVKAPTGDSNAKDLSQRPTGSVERPVDPSIQPGDGGWGLVLELQAYQKVWRQLYGYVSGSYMITPQEQNGTEFTVADRPGFLNSIKYDSIADQYLGRGGFSYVVWPARGLSLSFGARIEGIPAYDALGGSMGFRRPGYTVAVEPGLSWMGRRNSLSLLTPVAVYRNRERSAPETEADRPGGDAAFADFSILAAFSHRF